MNTTQKAYRGNVKKVYGYQHHEMQFKFLTLKGKNHTLMASDFAMFEAKLKSRQDQCESMSPVFKFWLESDLLLFIRVCFINPTGSETRIFRDNTTVAVMVLPQKCKKCLPRGKISTVLLNVEK